MNAGEVRDLAREWVEVEGSKTPGFHGAHLMGSIVGMSCQEPFPLWKDVDLGIVVPEGHVRENIDLAYRGLVLEVSFHALRKYSSARCLLPNAMLAPCFAMHGILSDPTGKFREMEADVASDYAQREWVTARCDYEKRVVLRHLDAMDSTESPFYDLHEILCYLVGLVAVAELRLPTDRRCLILARELLEPRGRSDLCDEILTVLGFAHLSPTQVELHLQEAMAAFDRAVEVYRTPIPYGFKFQPYNRPYFAEGAREMALEDHHREAMWWIWGVQVLSNAALQQDAREKERSTFQAACDRLLADMGLSTPDDWEARVEQARALAEKVFRVADEIVATNPEIVD